MLAFRKSRGNGILEHKKVLECMCCMGKHVCVILQKRDFTFVLISH